MSADCWYKEALDRKNWRGVWSQRLDEYQQQQQQQHSGGVPGERNVICMECGQAFRRESDRARHRCRSEREKPMREQAGAVQCGSCERWFRSRGGLAVRQCRRDQVEEDSAQTGGTRSDEQIVCRVCGRAFRRQGDLKRHKCLSEREKPVEEQQGAAQCAVCWRWFQSANGLAVHKRVHTREPREVPNANRV